MKAETATRTERAVSRKEDTDECIELIRSALDSYSVDWIRGKKKPFQRLEEESRFKDFHSRSRAAEFGQAAKADTSRGARRRRHSLDTEAKVTHRSYSYIYLELIYILIYSHSHPRASDAVCTFRFAFIYTLKQSLQTPRWTKCNDNTL